jgi:pimeloyl-ACP methyl ester carboxylesterase
LIVGARVCAGTGGQEAVVLSGYRAPPATLLATELPRAGLDLAALVSTSPLLATARRGDGHPVLVLPGLLAGDPATVLLRAVLRALGHNVSGWMLGTNRGGTFEVVQALRRRLERLHRESGQRVSLVGWSLGGVFAQELARSSPGSVRGLITLGSPLQRRSGWTQQLSKVVDEATHLPAVASRIPGVWAESGSLRVPATSVYTKSDGVVNWSTSRYAAGVGRENVRVRGSHLGLAHNPAVLWLLADRLAQAEGSWRPFLPPLALRPLFPRTA